MSRLFVPPAVARELVLERAAEEQRLAQFTYMGDVMADFNRDLKRIDPYLELARAQDTIRTGTALKPGYWHIIRHNPGAPPSVMPIEGPDGEYVEPSSAVFEMLKRNDLQNPATGRRRRERERELEAAKARREARETEEMNAEVLERVLAVSRAQVSMSGSWSQNHAGRRGRRVD